MTLFVECVIQIVCMNSIFPMSRYSACAANLVMIGGVWLSRLRSSPAGLSSSLGTSLEVLDKQRNAGLRDPKDQVEVPALVFEVNYTVSPC